MKIIQDVKNVFNLCADNKRRKKRF